uniref:Uncharacterized protein n=1 Tax=Meleagris gallopavo TaxID=9103 RepID=A0A803YK67_MELGA
MFPTVCIILIQYFFLSLQFQVLLQFLDCFFPLILKAIWDWYKNRTCKQKGFKYYHTSSL